MDPDKKRFLVVWNSGVILVAVVLGWKHLFLGILVLVSGIIAEMLCLVTDAAAMKRVKSDDKGCLK